MERRTFIKQSSLALIATATTTGWKMDLNSNDMHDVIIIGGSYSGLSAALALGRSHRNVLIIDANEPCNARVPHSHNLLTHDGVAPKVLREQAIADVAKYPTVKFQNGRATEVSGTNGAFTVRTADGTEHRTRKLLLALGVHDELPAIPGLADCWGISAAACPFCHGYEVSGKRIAIIGNTPDTFDYAHLLHNWSLQLVVLTNGPATFTSEQRTTLTSKGIEIMEQTIEKVMHDDGQVSTIHFHDGSSRAVEGLFLRSKTTVRSPFVETLGLERTEQGLIKVDPMQRTNVPGVYGIGDCTTPIRAISMAIAAGNMAGAVLTHELVATAQH
jgi:thioredoxin reductase